MQWQTHNSGNERRNIKERGSQMRTQSTGNEETNEWNKEGYARKVRDQSNDMGFGSARQHAMMGQHRATSLLRTSGTRTLRTSGTRTLRTPGPGPYGPGPYGLGPYGPEPMEVRMHATDQRNGRKAFRAGIYVLTCIRGWCAEPGVFTCIREWRAVPNALTCNNTYRTLEMGRSRHLNADKQTNTTNKMQV